MSIANLQQSWIFIHSSHPLYIWKQNLQAAMEKEDCGSTAGRHNSVKMWVEHTEYTVSQKIIDGEMNTICDYRYENSIPKIRNVFDFG